MAQQVVASNFRKRREEDVLRTDTLAGSMQEVIARDDVARYRPRELVSKSESLGNVFSPQRLQKTHSLLPAEMMVQRSQAEREAERQQYAEEKREHHRKARQKQEEDRSMQKLQKRNRRREQEEVHVPGRMRYSRPVWLSQYVLGKADASETQGDSSIVRYGDVQSQFLRELKLELDVLQGIDLPSIDFKNERTGLPYVKIEYEGQTDSTRPVKKKSNPTWDHFMVFRFFPFRVLIRGKLYHWNNTNRHDVIGVFELYLDEGTQSVMEEQERMVLLVHPDGTPVMGANKQSELIFRYQTRNIQRLLGIRKKYLPCKRI